MSRILAFVILSGFATVNFAQTVELVCVGEIQTRLSGYMGAGRTNWTDDIKLEVAFLPKSKTVKRAYTSHLLLSLCYLDASVKKQCTCLVNDDNIACVYKDAELGQSSISINRKTAIAKVFESSTFKNPDGKSTFTQEKSAEVSCQVFDKNRF